MRNKILLIGSGKVDDYSIVSRECFDSIMIYNVTPHQNLIPVANLWFMCSTLLNNMTHDYHTYKSIMETFDGCIISYNDYKNQLILNSEKESISHLTFNEYFQSIQKFDVDTKLVDFISTYKYVINYKDNTGVWGPTSGFYSMLEFLKCGWDVTLAGFNFFAGKLTIGHNTPYEKSFAEQLEKMGFLKIIKSTEYNYLDPNFDWIPYHIPGTEPKYK